LKPCNSVAVLEDLAHRFALRWTQVGATEVLTNAVTHERVVLALALAHELDIAAFVSKTSCSVVGSARWVLQCEIPVRV